MKLSFKIAFSGLMAALGVAIMLLGGVIPIMTYVSPLLASVFLIPVNRELGKKWSWMTWFTVSALSILMGADKEAGFFYLFLGYYPLIKEYLDRIRNKAMRILAKAGVFAIAVAAMYAVLLFVLALPEVMADFMGAGTVLNIAMSAVMVLIMLCFDVVDGFAVKYYEVRIHPKLKRMV